MSMTDSIRPSEAELSGLERVQIHAGPDFIQAQQAAWDEAERKRDRPVMTAWFDRDAEACFPNPVCTGDEGPGWLYYARSSGADLAVCVDDDRYVFLFKGD